MGERSLLFRALLEHRDRRPNALIDDHHEYLVLVAKENCAAAAGCSHAADLHFDNGLTHTASLVTRLSCQDPNCFQRVIKNQTESAKIRSARVSGHRSKGMRVRPPNLHSRMSDRRLAQSVVGNPG